jgi:ABC-type transporter Mla subunit MlaD
MAEKGTLGGTPRWVKVFGIIALVLLVLVVVMIVVGRGGHGPGRHTGEDTQSGDIGGHGPPRGARIEP